MKPPRIASTLLLAFLATACAGEPEQSGRNDVGNGTVAAVLPFASFESAPVESIVAYASTLVYATDHGVTDMQRLSVRAPGAPPCPEGCSLGPKVTIQPQVGSLGLTPQELREGRVIGRLLNEDTLAYERFNLSAGGTTYVVVVATDSTPWTGYLVSSDPARGTLSRIPHPITVDAPHQGRYLQSTARFLWTDAGESLWWDCGAECCVMSPI